METENKEQTTLDTQNVSSNNEQVASNKTQVQDDKKNVETTAQNTKQVKDTKKQDETETIDYEQKKVYLDNAATTYVSSEALREMIPTFTSNFGNPSSVHSFGRNASALVDMARDRVAKAIGAESNEIYFVSSGSEANNLAIKGIAHANRDKGNHIITSCIEHPSVLEACKQLEKEGFKVTYLNVDNYGLIDFAQFLDVLTDDTILISIMAANNEIATIQNIQAIAQTAKEKEIIFHTDAVQSFGSMGYSVKDMNIDALTISGHKIYGPKGAAALYVKNGVKIEPLIAGGNQERGIRGGTVDVPAVVGFGKACEIAVRDMAINNKKLRFLREYFVKNLLEKIPNVTINGHPHQKVNNIVSVTFKYVNGDAVLAMLDLKGIAVSRGSACSAGVNEKSYVLKAIGLEDQDISSTIRFSFGKSNTKEEIDYTIDCLSSIVEKLRQMSPIKKKRTTTDEEDE
jgi:cysteine desulfurase